MSRIAKKSFSHWKSLLWVAILLLAFSLSFTAVAGMNPCAGIELGTLAPDFTLKDLNGKKHTLSDYRGRVVLLNFWATWCGPCVHEMPSMESLNQKLKEDKFVILAVSLDRGDLGRVKTFVEKNSLSFPVLHTSDASLQKIYNTSAIPLSFVINKDGTIYSCIPGAQKWDCLDAINHIKGALDKKP